MAKRKTKANFSIYPLNTLNFKKLMIKTGIKSARKKSIPELAGEIFKLLKHSSLDHHLCATETLWYHEGKNVLFLPDDGFVDDLLKASYHMDGDAVLCLPHSTFILGMPHFTIDNIVIPSVIVHFCTAADRIERYMWFVP